MVVEDRLIVEYSKSARAACPLCGSTIAKDVVRIGRESIVSGRPQVRWHHPNCFGEHHPNTDFAKMSGFLLLKSTDQASLRVVRASADKGTGSNTTNIVLSAVQLVECKSSAPTVDLSNFHPSQLFPSYKNIRLPDGWKAFLSVILYASDNCMPSEKIAAFDFDGTLANTSVSRPGADKWSLLHPSIPAKLASYHQQGYKLVIFTNEANIDRFTNKRAAAIDSKLGRLKGFMQIVKVPLQVFVACAKVDEFRKPGTGMWHLLDHLNAGVSIDKERSFYVGDAAGRKNDHSDADIKFAKTLGLKFLLPEQFFLPESHESAELPHHTPDEIQETAASDALLPTETLEPGSLGSPISHKL